MLVIYCKGRLVMNLRVGSLSGEVIKCDKDADSTNLYKVYAQYGVEPGIQGLWEEIINLDGERAKQKVDALLEKMEMYSEKNGFFDANQNVNISYSGFGFKMDDYNLYYMFFNNLKDMYESEVGRQNKGSIIFNSIKQTIKDYFGGFIKDSLSEKKGLTFFDENGEYPSISEQRNKGTASSVEMAAVSHNLWLLTGMESFYINSKDFKLEEKRKGLEDGHVFNIVNTGNGYRVCDFMRNCYAVQEENPIDLIKNGKPIAFGSEVYYGTDLQSDLQTERAL